MEKRVALIPRVQYSPESRSTLGEYALYLTDLRSILVQEKAATKLPLWGGPLHMLTIATAIEDSKKPLQTRDYGNVTPDELASLPGSLYLDHNRLHRMEVEVVFETGHFQFFFTARKLPPHRTILVAAPEALLQTRKAEGQPARKTRMEYIHQAQEAYRQALPPAVAEASKWLR